ncbi:MAG: cytidine deaminase [Chloroflexota bacterium]
MTIQQALEQQLAQFPETGRELLTQIVTYSSFAGVIPAVQAQALTAQMAISVDDLMHALVPIARCYAYPPISNYHVGTIVRGVSGNLYFGANLEFPGLGLNMTVHGEQAAVVNARQHGETKLVALAVNGTPCGHCRQFLAEMNNPDLVIVYSDGNSPTLAQVLPHAFTPSALKNEQGLLDQIDPKPQLTLESDDGLVRVALKTAVNSYVPYSKNWAGVAVRLTNGFVTTGAYMENAAFNPSLSPLLSALVILRMNQQPWQEIEDAILVEKASLSSQAHACRALLATLGDVELRYHAL